MLQTFVSKLAPLLRFRRALRVTLWSYLRTQFCVPSTRRGSPSCRRICSWHRGSEGVGREIQPPRVPGSISYLQVLKSCFHLFRQVSLGQHSSKHITSFWPISYVRNLLSLCCRHRRTEHSTLFEADGCGTGEIKNLRNIVATGSAGTSKMIFHRLPTTHSLVPVDNQVTYIFFVKFMVSNDFFMGGVATYIVIIIIKYRKGGWTSTHWCRTPTLAR